MHLTTRLQRACSLISTPHSVSTGLSPTSQTRSHVWPGTQISAWAWARRDPSSASLTNLWARRSSIRTSRSFRYVRKTYCINCLFFLSLLRDHRNASPVARTRRTRRARLLWPVRRAPLPPIRLLRLARRVPLSLPPIRLLRLARRVPLSLPPIRLPRLAQEVPLSLPPIRLPRLARGVPPPPIRLLRPVRGVPLPPIQLLRPARGVPLPPIRPLKPVRPIRLLRPSRRAPLRRPIQGVTSTLPDQYDTAHDLDVLLFLTGRLEPSLMSIPNFNIYDLDIYVFMNKCS
jgi:hypothetical protein